MYCTYIDDMHPGSDHLQLLIFARTDCIHNIERFEQLYEKSAKQELNIIIIVGSGVISDERW